MFVYLQGSLLATREHHFDTGVASWNYQHTDALGSPIAVSNPAGTVIDRTNWEPWGAAIGKPTMDQVGFTGHQMDGITGLIHMQQRYYDPDTGRFLSVDPVNVDIHIGNNFNRYWYANSNPYKFKDPDGRCPICIPVIFGIGALLHAEPANAPGRGERTQTTSFAEAASIAVPGGRVVGPLKAGMKIGIKATDNMRSVTKLGGFKSASKGHPKGVDEHAFKKSVMGNKVQLKTHGISVDNKGNVILTPVKNGGELMETGYKLKELPIEFSKK